MADFKLQITGCRIQHNHVSTGSIFRIGQMQINVPRAMTKPPIHIQITSGRTSALSVA
jgi:hypothetical protein